jgi:DNA-binding transcriptional regulator YiaG
VNSLTEEVLRSRRLPPPTIARAIRREAGVSQQRLASELGVHRVTVARWEIGMRVPRGALRLHYADVLDELQREVLSS